MRALVALLENEIGLDCGSIGLSIVGAAVQERMHRVGVSSEDAYVRLATSSPEETRALVEEVVVSETWFMRDREAFDHLAELARLHHKQAPFKVLSAPCATGEEAYSIAITLLGAGLDKFAIDALDVSGKAIAHARAGVYEERSFRGEIGELKQRWFRSAGSRHTVDPGLSERIRFGCDNLLEPHSIGLERYDAVFCRNLLIYLGKDARAKVLSVLDRVLAKEGTLFVGGAESVHAMDSNYARVGPVGAFAYQRTEKTKRSEPTLSGQKAPAASGTRKPHGKTSGRARGGVPGRAAPTLSDSDEPGTRHGSPNSRPGSSLERAREAADRGELELGRALAEEYGSQHRGDAEGHALLGVIQHALGRVSEAERCFERALYLAPDHEEALFHLARIAELRGERERAQNFARRLERVRVRRST